MNKICVVIPIHSPDPSLYELISFQQCFKILNKYVIYIIAPVNLPLIKYKEVIPEFQVIYIDPKWQSSIITYNKLKTSRFFYDLFKNYDFLLTYELDAFIFKDDIEYWCNQGFDYIGAPWLEGYDKPNLETKFIGVGNSGFSLRAIKPIRKILKLLYYKNPSEYCAGSKQLFKAYLKAPYRWMRNQMGENYTVQMNYHMYEDRFFSDTIPNLYPEFIIAPVEEAIKFSFEVKPEVLFEVNNWTLPTGCHAWWRYNLSFWKPYIESFGYIL